MAINQILPFGTVAGANVLDPADYQTLAARLGGFSAGTAKSKELNTVWRQASCVAAMIGQYIADKAGQDVLDDGDLAALQAKFVAALAASPALTGTPTAPTPAAGDKSTKLATTAFVTDTVGKATAGVLSVARGGTGLGAVADGHFLVGRGAADALIPRSPAEVFADLGIAQYVEEQRRTVVLTVEQAADANMLTAPDTLYKWINMGPKWANFPNLDGAGYLHTYFLGTSTVVQELTLLETGSKAIRYYRFGIPGRTWQPWRVASAFSHTYQLPNWDAGDVYVDSLGWHRWVNTPGYTGYRSLNCGQIAYFITDQVPTGWVKADGSLVSRTKYAGLYSVIGDMYTGVDGVTTFRLPDLRGEFIRGLDDSRGIDPGRSLGSNQAATAIRVLIDNYYAHTVGTFAIGMRNADGRLTGAGSENYTVGSDTTFYVSTATQYNSGIGDNLSYFVRPRNVALMAYIKI